jgi:pseudouridine synthase
MDFIDRKEHLFSIGRLDADSEGLVVMTNDGETAQRLSHPRYRHSKTYRVEVFGLPTAETLEKWRDGIFLEEGKAAPCFIEIVKGSVKGTTLRIIMTEGKKRQIRRVATALGHPVQRLLRTHIGMYALGDLVPGATRVLTAKDVIALSTPAPEIKLLRAQPRRTRRSETDANVDTNDGRANPRARDASNADLSGDDRRVKSASYSEGSTGKSTRKRGTARPTEMSNSDAKPRARRTPITASYDESGDKPRTRRTAGIQPTDATDEKPRRRTPRSDSFESNSEKPRPRRTPRSQSSDTATNKPRIRRVRSKSADVTDEKPRPRRTPRPATPDTTPSKPRARSGTESSDDEQRPKRVRKTYPPRKNSTDAHRERKRGNRKKTRK